MLAGFFRSQDSHTKVNFIFIVSKKEWCNIETHPERSLRGDCLKIGPYFVGHSSVSRSTRLVSVSPEYRKYAERYSGIWWAYLQCQPRPYLISPVWRHEEIREWNQLALAKNHHSWVQSSEATSTGVTRQTYYQPLLTVDWQTSWKLDELLLRLSPVDRSQDSPPFVLIAR